MEKVKVCAKCGKVLPATYKGKKCEACMNKYSGRGKTFAAMVLMIGTAAIAIARKVVRK